MDKQVISSPYKIYYHGIDLIRYIEILASVGQIFNYERNVSGKYISNEVDRITSLKYVIQRYGDLKNMIKVPNKMIRPLIIQYNLVFIIYGSIIYM